MILSRLRISFAQRQVFELRSDHRGRLVIFLDAIFGQARRERHLCWFKGARAASRRAIFSNAAVGDGSYLRDA